MTMKLVESPPAGRLAASRRTVLVRSRTGRREAWVEIDDILALVARATARHQCADIGFYDPAAERMLADLELVLPAESTLPDWSAPVRFGQDLGARVLGQVGVDSPRAARALVLSTFAIDEIVREFFSKNPDGVGIALQPGLCSRFSRVDNGCLQWVDIDPPALAELKCSVLRTPSRHLIATSCGLSCRGWLDAVDSAHDAPILLVHQGAMKAAEQLPALFDRLVRRAPARLEYVADYDARAPLLGSSSARPGLQLVGQDGTVHAYPRAKLMTLSAPVRTLVGELPPASSVVHLSFV